MTTFEEWFSEKSEVYLTRLELATAAWMRSEKQADQARLKMCVDICKEIADEFQAQKKDDFGKMATTGARACEHYLRSLLLGE